MKVNGRATVVRLPVELSVDASYDMFRPRTHLARLRLPPGMLRAGRNTVALSAEMLPGLRRLHSAGADGLALELAAP